jgi:hypothetical protein
VPRVSARGARVGEIDVRIKLLREFTEYLDTRISTDIEVVGWQRAMGCRKDGFIGLLTPLQGSMGVLLDLSVQAAELMRSKMLETRNGIVVTANNYEQTEGHATKLLGETGGER